MKNFGSKIIRVSKKIIDKCYGFQFESDTKREINFNSAIHYGLDTAKEFKSKCKDGKFVGCDVVNTKVKIITIVTRCGNCGDFLTVDLTREQLLKMIKLIDTGKMI